MSDPLIGKQLGDYVIQSLLGRGGMARVYKGYDDRLQRYAAVKVINSDFNTADQAEYAERFRREARAIARLHHPNIVGVFQFGEYESHYYMAMVFIEGKDLRQILKEHADHGTRLPYEDVLNVIRGISSALDYAHSRGVIHRDIKPSNIMLDTENRAVLTDFGLALSIQEGTLGDTFGSAHYIAPEQAVSSAKAVPQSDLYSLGICLYEMLAGQVPFDDPSAMSVALKHLNDAPPPPHLFNPELAPAIERVVLKVLDKDPNSRYASGALFTQALEIAMRSDASDATVTVEAPSQTNGSKGAATPAPQPEKQVKAEQPKGRAQPLESRRMTPLHSPDPNQDVISTAIGAIPVPITDSQMSAANVRAAGNTADNTADATPAPAGTTPKPQGARSKVPWMPIVGGGLVVLIVGGLLIGAAGRNQSSTPTPTVRSAATVAPTQAVALLPATGTATNTVIASETVTPSTRPTEVSTNTSSGTDTLQPTTEEPTSASSPGTTEQATSISATSTVATSPATEAVIAGGPTVPSGSPVPTANGSGNITLAYDDYQFILINSGDQPLNVSKLHFEQRGSDSTIRSFDASLWSASITQNAADSLLPRFCLQIWRNDRIQPTPVPGCSIIPVNFRAAWAKVAEGRRFWIPIDSTVSTFDVSLNGKVLATCNISAGHCEVTLP